MIPTTAKLLSACEVPGTLLALCHDPQGGRLFGAGSDRSVYAVDPAADDLRAEKKWTHHENFVSSLLCADGVVVSGGFDQRLVWTDADSGEKVRAIDAHDGWVRDLCWLSEGKLLASAGDDMLVKVWDAATGRLVQTLDGHARQTPQGYATALYAVAASPDSKLLAGGDRTGEVVLWEAETGKQLGRLKAPAFYTFDAAKRHRSLGGIRSLSFSPDGTRLAIAGIGAVSNVDGFVGPCRVEVWDPRAGRRLFVGQDGHKAVLNCVAFHPSEPWLAAGGGGDSGGILAFWDQQKEAPVLKAKPKGHLQRLCFDAASPRIFAAGFGGFQVWGFGDEPA